MFLKKSLRLYLVSGKYQNNNNNNKENNFLNLIYYAKYKKKLNIIKIS